MYFFLTIFNIVATVIIVSKIGNNCGCFGKAIIALGSLVALKLLEYLLIGLLTFALFV